MNKKIIAVLFIILAVNGTGSALERIKAKVSLQELRNPESPHYVPHPFPRNRKEVITDFRHHVRRYCNRFYWKSRGASSVYELFFPQHILADIVYWLRQHCMISVLKDPEATDIYDIILPHLLKDHSNFRIARVYKVFNLHHRFPYSYHYTLEITDSRGNFHGQTAVSAEGLFMGAGLREKPHPCGPSLAPGQVIALLKKAGVLNSGDEKIELRRIGYNPLVRSYWGFAWHIRTEKKEYFMQDSPAERRLYRVRLRRKWRLNLSKDGNGQLSRKSTDQLLEFHNALPEGDKEILDSVHEQMIVATPMKIDLKHLPPSGEGV